MILFTLDSFVKKKHMFICIYVTITLYKTQIGAFLIFFFTRRESKKQNKTCLISIIIYVYFGLGFGFNFKQMDL